MENFDRCSFINSLKEGIGLKLYFCDNVHFYAWDANQAIKKAKYKNLKGQLYIIDVYGDKIDVKNTII